MEKLNKANRAVNLFISFSIILMSLVIVSILNTLIGYKETTSMISELLHDIFLEVCGICSGLFLWKGIKGKFDQKNRATDLLLSFVFFLASFSFFVVLINILIGYKADVSILTGFLHDLFLVIFAIGSGIFLWKAITKK